LLKISINTNTYVKSLPGEKEGSQGKTTILFCPLCRQIKLHWNSKPKNCFGFSKRAVQALKPKRSHLSISDERMR
jgi:hypothetical protein